MGYAMGYAPCYVCNRLFSFNPAKVPNYKNNPICRPCMEAVNQKRRELGNEPFDIPADAYEPCSEEEL